MSEENIDQKKINEIWRNQWNLDSFTKVRAENFFLQRLFVEGYSIIKKYIPREAIEIIDVGGGTGRYGLQIAQDRPISRVVISDILEEALNIGRKLTAELDIRNVDFQRDDILFSSFPDNRFDAVVSDVVIQHLPDYICAIKEIRRITKPGGKILISSVNFWNFHTLFKLTLRLLGKKYEYGYEKSFSKKELTQAMEKEGIKIIASDGFYVGYGIFRLKKYHRGFHFLGRVINRISKFLDKFTGRFFSRNFGFEIVVIGEK